MDISVIAIGDELLIGQVTDTNSGWIARHLNPLGWRVKYVKVIADDKDEITKAIDEALSITDIVLTTGGLGPTKDDITKGTLLEYFGGEMIYDKAVEANLAQVIKNGHYKINPLTAAQAYVPSSCRVIQNRVGTAPIMWFEKNDKVLVSMPGVPSETETMMEAEVIPQLINRFSVSDHIMHKTFLVVDYAESQLAIKLEEFENSIPDYIKLAYLPKPSLIRLRFTGVSKDKNQLAKDIEMLSAQLMSILGDSIISDEDISLTAILGNYLRNNKLTLSTAESCTGGNIAHEITSVAGSSDYYTGGVIAYSNDVKRDILKVDSTTLDTHGAVSQETVEEMSAGVATLMGSNCSISTSGIAGPAGGSDEKPVGTVWISTFIDGNCTATKYNFGGNRSKIIERATTTAITMLIKELRKRYLSKKPQN